MFGGETRWIENLGEKMRRKIFFSVFSWVRRKENIWWNPDVFSSGPPKCFLPKMETKLSGDEFFLD